MPKGRILFGQTSYCKKAEHIVSKNAEGAIHSSREGRRGAEPNNVRMQIVLSCITLYTYEFLGEDEYARTCHVVVGERVKIVTIY